MISITIIIYILFNMILALHVEYLMTYADNFAIGYFKK